MIAWLIERCLRGRTVVLLLTAFVVAGGVWSVQRISIDAIPDLSDVQVVIRTEYPGQAPQIVEDQVTYPLTTAMLAVPYAKVVRGYSMFGTSFVYIIFEDGTDMYWARSRVLEQLSFVSGALPKDVSPQLGPDATGVGWVFEYVLVTGRYCPDHPNGLWHDPDHDAWFEDPLDAHADHDTERELLHHRTFPQERVVFVDRHEGRRYEVLEAAPPEVRDRLERVVLTKGYERCPLDGNLLEESAADLSDLRGLQDWYLRYELTAVEGVSEVASLGGFVKQYQVVVDPIKLLAFDLPLARVMHAVKRSNADVGGRLIEVSETEYMVRGVGYLGTLTDEEVEAAHTEGRSLEQLRTDRALEELGLASLGAADDGTPIYLRDVADIRIGPQIRRGVLDWNGEGEAVAGIIVMRFGENARTVIERVRDRLADLERGLPPGVGLEVGYDRSDLITRSVKTLTNTMIQEIIVVTLICIVFLLHARSAFVAVFVLPTGVLLTLTIMNALGINANIMSLGGIAISIGVMVDSSIVMVENAHKHIEQEKERVAAGKAPTPRAQLIATAAREVGPSLFFSLLIITISFIPVLALGEQAGRLFKPLAYTYIFAMGSSAILAVTVIPVLMTMFVSEHVISVTLRTWARRSLYLGIIGLPTLVIVAWPWASLGATRWWLAGGWFLLSALIVLPQRIMKEDRLPAGRLLLWFYRPLFTLSMRFWPATLALALALTASVSFPFQRLGSEFMPPLEEGDLLYMPSADPGISITKARELLQQTDKIVRSFPEVQTVMGKIGRAETATDPAPPPMFETVITLKRDKAQWRQVPRSFGGWPLGTRWIGRLIKGETRPITVNELVYGYEDRGSDGPSVRVPGLDETLRIPGLTNAWTMPIKTRIDMLSTGIKTPVGIKVMGPDLPTLAGLSSEIAAALMNDGATAPYTASAFPEKSVGGNYFDIRIDRREIARYGLSVGDVQDVIMTAMGGMTVSSTVEGLERYPVNLRYPHELRDNLPALERTLVATPSGAQVPLGQLASLVVHKGAPQIKSENARLTSWVFVDIKDIDVGTYVAAAQRVVTEQIQLPAGYSIMWSGQFEYMQAARARLLLVAPITAILIVLLLYASTRSWIRVGMVLLTVPLSLIGAFWLLWALQYNMSVAVWVGVIALAGLDAEMGLVLLLYLDLSYERFRATGRMRNHNDLWHAVYQGALERVRPITMTTMTSFIALTPLLAASGAGADTMRRLAVPVIGGLATGYVGVLFVLPIVYYLVKRAALARTSLAKTMSGQPTLGLSAEIER